MPIVLLVLFPILLLFNTPLAYVSLAVAIVLLYRGRTQTRTQAPRERIEDHSV